MSKFDYEIEKYIVKYGDGKEVIKTSEERAVEFAKIVENENPCIYRVERMIMDDIRV